MLTTRAHRAALVVVCPYPIQGHCTGDTSLSIGARPWCDVPAAASKAQPAFAWHARKRATAFAVYRELTQHACLRSTHAVPGWL